MYRYVAYGLEIASMLLLPDLTAGRNGVDADVEIRQARLNRGRHQTDTDLSYAAVPGEAYIFSEHLGTFRIRDGREIVFDPSPGVEDRLLQSVILGLCLSAILHQRGFFVLHASAVAVGDDVVAFLGEKGRGKSTIAASLYRRGHKLVADDILALDVRPNQRPLVVPGYPQFRLFPDAVLSLGNDPKSLPHFHTETEKRIWPVQHSFLQTPLPLKCIYLLDERGGSGIEIEQVSRQDAVPELMKHTFEPGFLYDTESLQKHLQRCAVLASTVRICWLRPPDALSALPEISARIEEDVACEEHLS